MSITVTDDAATGVVVLTDPEPQTDVVEVDSGTTEVIVGDEGVAGPPGPQGTVGPTGPAGPAGPEGRRPQRWYGDGPPGTIIGAAPDDEYVDRLTGDLYVLQ